MANIKSQKKRIITNEKARLKNKSVKSNLKTIIAQLEETLGGADAEAAKKGLATAVSKIDKASASRTLHKNKAARIKSRLMKKANPSKAAPDAAAEAAEEKPKKAPAKKAPAKKAPAKKPAAKKTTK